MTDTSSTSKPHAAEEQTAPAGWWDALVLLGVNRSTVSLAMVMAASGAAGWFAHAYHYDAVIAATGTLQKTAEMQASLWSAEATQARGELVRVKAELATAATSRDQAQAALRQSPGGASAVAMQERAEKAEQELRSIWLQRDRIDRSLAAAESELQRLQKENEQIRKDDSSFKSVAFAMLPQMSLKSELQKLEAEKSALLKQAEDLAAPSSDAPWATRQIRREQIMSEVEFKRRLIDNITQRCKVLN